MRHEGVLTLIRQDMDRAIDESRRNLAQQLYRDGFEYTTVVTFVPPFRVRVWRRMKLYALGWREALGCVWRAVIGREVIPTCEHDY